LAGIYIKARVGTPIDDERLAEIFDVQGLRWATSKIVIQRWFLPSMPVKVRQSPKRVVITVLLSWGDIK
jgi:hypothetical protein